MILSAFFLAVLTVCRQNRAVLQKPKVWSRNRNFGFWIRLSVSFLLNPYFFQCWHSDKDSVGCIGHRDKRTTCWSRVRDQSFLISFIDLPLWPGLSRSQAGYVGRRGQLYNCVGKSCDYETQKLNRRGSTTFNASLTLPDLYLGHCVWYVGMITWYLGHCIWYLWMIIWHFIKIRLGAVIWERRWQQPLPDPPVEGGYTLWSSTSTPSLSLSCVSALKG